MERYPDCVERLIELRETDPTHLGGVIQLGTCYLRLKEYQKAREAYTSVLEIEPDNDMALQNYGDTMYTYCIGCVVPFKAIIFLVYSTAILMHIYSV